MLSHRHSTAFSTARYVRSYSGTIAVIDIQQCILHFGFGCNRAKAMEMGKKMQRCECNHSQAKSWYPLFYICMLVRLSRKTVVPSSTGGLSGHPRSSDSERIRRHIPRFIRMTLDPHKVNPRSAFLEATSLRVVSRLIACVRIAHTVQVTDTFALFNVAHDFLDEVLILNGFLLGVDPAVRSPSLEPRGDAVDGVAGVGVYGEGAVAGR